MPDIDLAFGCLSKFNLKLEDAIGKCFYQTHEGDYIALYDFDGESEYKGIICYSNENRIGNVDWWSLKDLKKIDF